MVRDYDQGTVGRESRISLETDPGSQDEQIVQGEKIQQVHDFFMGGITKQIIGNDLEDMENDQG
jgi:hypothetical protein